MALNGLVLLDFVVNAGFALIALIIIYAFLRRFENGIPFKQNNVLGFIFLAFGLTFHIVGHLFAVLVTETDPENSIIHLIVAFKSLSVAIFILGSFILAHYTTKSENLQRTLVFLAISYGLVGLLEIAFHVSKFFGEGLFSANTLNVFLSIEMVSLILVYAVLFIQSRRAIRRVVSIRYQLLATTSLGFVLVILVDLLINLAVIQLDSLLTIFIIFFILHVITVGALYLLVMFPKRFQVIVGIAPSPSPA